MKFAYLNELYALIQHLRIRVNKKSDTNYIITQNETKIIVMHD